MPENEVGHDQQGPSQRAARAWRRAARALTPAGECEPAPIHGRSPESERGCNADIYNDASPSLAVKLNAWAIQLPKHGRGSSSTAS
ncbi:hypothetical protein OsI_27149 [Oryza sativa Indica Group]|uniref:Uncharacterized protein n=1 Tax=Oryza sativa subsp. indica TaxID=39946 RepID=A2YPF6_ORYSI|nr:hypothetical protein OsI_27149 [Oryza sativa Indica Group]